MIVCPNCKHENTAGAMFCEECGIQLVGSDMLATQKYRTDQMTDVPFVDEKVPSKAAKGSGEWASLHLIESGQILPLNDRTEFTIGRISDAQPVMPDIDLTPFQAYANGVSRLHVVIKHNQSQTFVMDLGSSNGTYLNGKRIPPNVDMLVNHGDMLSLGKLRIQLLLRNS